MALQPICFQQLQSPEPHAFGHGRADAAAVAVKADAVELHGLAVEQETFVDVEFDRADADGRVALVDCFVAEAQGAAKRVEIGRLIRPEIGILEQDLLGDLAGFTGVEFAVAAVGPYSWPSWSIMVEIRGEPGGGIPMVRDFVAS